MHGTSLISVPQTWFTQQQSQQPAAGSREYIPTRDTAASPITTKPGSPARTNVRDIETSVFGDQLNQELLTHHLLGISQSVMSNQQIDTPQPQELYYIHVELKRVPPCLPTVFKVLLRITPIFLRTINLLRV